MTISGVGTVQVFPANAGNGLGSATPPAGLTLAATSLGALGFGTFSVANPTITFIVADTFFGDNGGQYSLAQAAPPPAPSTANVPALGAWALIGLALMLALAAGRRLRR